MTLDQLLARDSRIAELEALPSRRAIERDELATLLNARDHHFRRVEQQLLKARRKAAGLELYMRQHRLPLPA